MLACMVDEMTTYSFKSFSRTGHLGIGTSYDHAYYGAINS
jgi:hypothetical protein